MDSDWQRIKEIVADALEHPATERSEFVRQACAGDLALQARVESYLKLEATQQGFMARPMFSIREEAEVTEVDTWVGRRVGGYVLKALIGHGGMGAVYVGERRDDDDPHEVAVKVLRPSGATRTLGLVLRRERKILRSLIHPYISRLLEGGSTDDGQPFFVMEKVEGSSIVAYCKQQRLSVAERIALFQKVCEAVRFAHSKAVIHCDLKPSNILVTADGQPRLLDFGVAWILERSVDPGDVGSHLVGLTKLYSSPEQIRAEEPTVKTDVYALGLLLYELLTGQSPHRLGMNTGAKIREVVCESTPPLPSQTLQDVEDGGEEIAPKALVGDLDSIIMKALEKEPDCRYSSVEALSEDLKRQRDRFPVMARRQALGYVVERFVRRNTGAFVAAAFLCVLVFWVLAQAIQISHQNKRLEGQNQVIRVERDRAESVRDFLVGFLRVSDPRRTKGADLTVREALVAAEEELRSDLRGEPAFRAELLDVIGRVYTNLALYSNAEPLLNEALEMRREAFGVDHPLVAESIHNLAYLKRRLGRTEEAVKLRQTAIGIQRTAYPEGDPALARGLNGLASLLREMQELDESEALVREALSLQVKLLGARDLDVARSLNTLASICRLRGDLDQAEDFYRQSLDIRRDHDGPIDPEIANVLNNLALVLVERGALSDAIEMHREALAIREEVYSEDHPKRVISLNNLALALSLQNEHEEALSAIEQARTMHEALEGSHTTGTTLQLNRASIVERGMWVDRCLDAIEPVLAELESTGRPHQVQDARSIRGGCLRQEGRFEEAEPILLGSLARLVELRGDTARQTKQARERVVALFEATGRDEPAEVDSSMTP